MKLGAILFLAFVMPFGFFVLAFFSFIQMGFFCNISNFIDLCAF